MLNRVVYYIKKYQQASNAKFNKAKTQAISFSGLPQPDWNTRLQQFGIPTCHDRTKPDAIVYLGYPLSSSNPQLQTFIDHLLATIKNHCNIHLGRGLSPDSTERSKASLAISLCIACSPSKALNPSFQEVKSNDIKSFDNSSFWEPDAITDVDFRALRQFMNVERATEELLLYRCKRIYRALEEEKRGEAYQNLISRKLPAAEKLYKKVHGHSRQYYQQQHEQEEPLVLERIENDAEEDDEEEECPEDRLMISFADIIMRLMLAQSGQENVEDLQRELGIHENFDTNDVP
ncbi:hypothetical protein BDB00DRAFT_872837 [Zychaea mexicana]|uniref:uncharacterized protein n=1 Tax=Zychaea mexicana TaxID=64656 RepID=UPI0022FE5FE2|nr:uncharacterized protein BDB00DRAFT_872837 [Zychaea mexicana]KAI9492978.1 hypothetical protein BDB00DRAFT_872837 [Zychaea mexicana]